RSRGRPAGGDAVPHGAGRGPSAPRPRAGAGYQRRPRRARRRRPAHPGRRLPRTHRPHAARGRRGGRRPVRSDRRPRRVHRPARPEDRSPLMTTTADTRVRPSTLRDTWNVLTRELKPVLRDPISMIFSLLQPLVFLGLFSPLLIGASGQSAAETLQWFVPGVIVMIVLFGTGATGSNLQYEM